MTKPDMNNLEQTARRWLEERGVTVEKIAELVYYLQSKYHPDLTMDECIENVNRVISKREVQNAILTGIQLDKLAEDGRLDERYNPSSAAMKGCTGWTKFWPFRSSTCTDRSGLRTTVISTNKNRAFCNI